jgi:hybrid cluster-associated redox disulfide protein
VGIDPTLRVSEVLKRWPASATVFVRRCMACVGCAMAPFDTLADAAAEYGLTLDGLLRELAGADGGGTAPQPRGKRAGRAGKEKA